jgi:hypothetical protein
MANENEILRFAQDDKRGMRARPFAALRLTIPTSAPVWLTAIEDDNTI